MSKPEAFDALTCGGLLHGWNACPLVSPDDMPAIERDLRNYNLTVGLDDGKWRWWLSLHDDPVALDHGTGADLLDAVWQVFDAVAVRLGAGSGESTTLTTTASLTTGGGTP